MAPVPIYSLRMVQEFVESFPNYRDGDSCELIRRDGDQVTPGCMNHRRGMVDHGVGYSHRGSYGPARLHLTCLWIHADYKILAEGALLSFVALP